MKTIKNTLTFLKKRHDAHPLLSTFIFSLTLSWVYAVCEQIVIPIPFNPVMMILQPLPLYFFALTFGWPAVAAFALYLIQITLGAPFMAYSLGGLARLMGPTGGYLIGMMMGATLLVLVREQIGRSFGRLVGMLWLAHACMFACGLVQLSLYVGTNNVLALGLWPFFIGDFVIKVGVVACAMYKRWG